MNFYETMYIVHPALQAGRLDDIIQEVVPDILSEQKLEYPCSPKVDILQKEPKFIISLQVPMMPEVTLGDYKSLNNKQKRKLQRKKSMRLLIEF